MDGKGFGGFFSMFPHYICCVQLYKVVVNGDVLFHILTFNHYNRILKCTQPIFSIFLRCGLGIGNDFLLEVLWVVGH